MLIRCGCCREAKSHFTAVDDGHMGYYCDECVIAGKLAGVGITMPDVPGVPQRSRESIIPTDFTSAPSQPRAC
jgi:hypothetical protein